MFNNKEQFKLKFLKKIENEKKKKIKHKICMNDFKNTIKYLTNKDIRSKLKMVGLVLNVSIVDEGTNYIRSKNVETINQNGDNTNNKLYLDIILENGQVKKASPVKDKGGFFYKTGDILMVCGGDRNCLVKVDKVWPIEIEN